MNDSFINNPIKVEYTDVTRKDARPPLPLHSHRRSHMQGRIYGFGPRADHVTGSLFIKSCQVLFLGPPWTLVACAGAPSAQWLRVWAAAERRNKPWTLGRHAASNISAPRTQLVFDYKLLPTITYITLHTAVSAHTGDMSPRPNLGSPRRQPNQTTNTQVRYEITSGC